MTLSFKHAWRVALLSAAALSVAGCDTLGIPDWFDTSKKPKIAGERIAVMSPQTVLTADAQLKDTPVVLPDPQKNDAWPEAGFDSGNLVPHLAADVKFQPVWSVSAGTGSNDEAPLTSSPVIADGNVFLIDADSTVSAFSVANGGKIWSTPLAPQDEDDPDRGFGGGVAFADDKVFATSGFGVVAALDAKTGKQLWRAKTDSPVHSAPVIAGGRVYVITRLNELLALDESNGQVLWDHTGSDESATMLTSSNVAVAGETVVVPYSSGELYALRVENGRPAWNNALTRSGNVTALTDINDIAGRPVIDRDMVLAANQSGDLVAMNFVNGDVMWTRDIASIQSPLVAGDFVYIVSTSGQVLCLLRRDGRVKWTTQLDAYEDPDDKEDPIVWSGPVLASNKLLLVSSTGEAIALSPFTGEKVEESELPEGTRVAPVIADGTLFVLTDDAQLLALR
jgi:outer membrane protein assembly factor BamB